MSLVFDAWTPMPGPITRRQCPECEWFMDEPPAESMTEATGDGWTYRIRQHSALPALAAHVMREHPDSDTAGQLRSWVAARRAEAS